MIAGFFSQLHFCYAGQVAEVRSNHSDHAP